MTDFTLQDSGALFILKPMTTAANDWCMQWLPEDTQRWAGGYVVEHRYIADICNGIDGDGLTINMESSER